MAVGISITLCAFFLPELHADKILIGDIMLLIPGLAMTNAVRDTMVGSPISGAMRLIETLLWAGALAMGFMSCIVNFGTVTLQSSINKLGTNIITAHTAARKIFDILDVVLYIIGNAVTTFVSQNLGAKRIDRVKTGVRAGIIINTIATTIIILIGFPASPLLIRLIAGTNDPAVIDPAVMYIRISVCCFYVLGPLFVLRCAMQGMGRKIVPVLSSTMEW